MNLNFIHVGGKNPAWLESVLSDYDKKISRFFKVERKLIKSPAIDRDDAKLKIEKEEVLILKALSDSSRLILLDETGKDFKSSRDFSQHFQKTVSAAGSGPHLTFLIGGAYGVGPEIKKRAEQSWRLSGLTFNHQLAQLVLTEQVYRAIAIWKNLPYHND